MTCVRPLRSVAHATESARAGQVGVALESPRRAVEADPLREPAVRTFMRLLAEQGRRSEALALYERLRQELTKVYGSDPDPKSRRLYRELLAGSVDTAPPPRPLLARSNIRPALTSFVGRERQIAEVHRELSRARLVTLTGPGGVGKTRLAEMALSGLIDRYRDGVWVVDLVPVTTVERLPDAVAEAMGLDPAAGADPMSALIGRLAARICCCFGQLRAPGGAVRGSGPAVAARMPELRVLTTSREPLHVPGEVTMRVPSLGVAGRGRVGGGCARPRGRTTARGSGGRRATDFRLDESNADRGRGDLPAAGRSAAGDRTGRRPPRTSRAGGDRRAAERRSGGTGPRRPGDPQRHAAGHP